MRIPPPIAVLFLLDLVVVACAIASYVISDWLGVERPAFFRLGGESNLPAWYSTSQILLIALLFGLLAWRDFRWSRAATWTAVVPAAFFLLLSLDEGAQVHERIGHWVWPGDASPESSASTGWILVVAPIYFLLSLVFAGAIWPYLRGRIHIVMMYVIGLGLFAFSAAGIEAIGGLTDASNDFARGLIGIFEEGGEMIAMTVLVWATFKLIDAENIRLNTAPAKPVGPAV